VDFDIQPGDGSRLVQITPPAPGSLQGLMLMVSDVGAGRVRWIVPHPEGWRIRPMPPQKPDGIV
jgi:hypothetical protein